MDDNLTILTSLISLADANLIAGGRLVFWWPQFTNGEVAELVQNIIKSLCSSTVKTPAHSRSSLQLLYCAQDDYGLGKSNSIGINGLKKDYSNLTESVLVKKKSNKEGKTIKLSKWVRCLVVVEKKGLDEIITVRGANSKSQVTEDLMDQNILKNIEFSSMRKNSFDELVKCQSQGSNVNDLNHSTEADHAIIQVKTAENHDRFDNIERSVSDNLRMNHQCISRHQQSEEALFIESKEEKIKNESGVFTNTSTSKYSCTQDLIKEIFTAAWKGGKVV